MAPSAGYNSKEAIRAWMKNSLDKSDITTEERHLLENVGERMIESGWWRGDISEIWEKMGFGSSKMHDLYL